MFFLTSNAQKHLPAPANKAPMPRPAFFRATFIDL